MEYRKRRVAPIVYSLFGAVGGKYDTAFLSCRNPRYVPNDILHILHGNKIGKEGSFE